MESVASMGKLFGRRRKAVSDQFEKTGSAKRPFVTELSTSLQSAADQLNLLQAEVGRTYIIKDINTTDPEMNAFLFRLGCYSGEPITLISKKRKSCIVAIKDSRYGLDNQLAEAVVI